MNLQEHIVSVLAALTVGASQVAMAGPSPIAATSPIEVKLVVPDTKLLPGVPFEMWMDVRNPSDARVGVGLCADMLVRPEGGQPFTISRGGEHGPDFPTLLPELAWNGAEVRYIVMRPRETQTLTLPILPELEGPNYFDDERLSKPGRYAISLRLDYCWPGFVTPQKSLLPPEFLGGVTTNEVTVERINPTGSDAKVWQRMQDLTNDKWIPINWPQTVTSEILAKYGDSNYFPYALLAASFGGVTETYLNQVLDAISRFPDSPVIEHLNASVWGSTSPACSLPTGYPRADICKRARDKVKTSKRPTTRILHFGREDVPPPPCPPQDDCED